MKAINGVVCLDFDGVICDSRSECMMASRWALRDLDEADIAMDMPAIKAEEKHRFFEFRHLVRVAAEYCLLWDILLSGRMPDHAVAIREQANVDEERLARFHDRFYAVRSVWRRNNPESWYDNNPLYPEMRTLLKRWVAHPGLFIVSAKDASSIAAILGKNAIDIASDRIFGDPSGDKPAIMEALMKRHGFAGGVFVDDHPANLVPFKGGRVRPYLAAWGYVAPGVEVKGVESLTIDQMGSLLEQWLDAGLGRARLV